MPSFLGLLLLLHLAGALRQPQAAMPQPQAPKPQPPGLPQSQGPQGVGQGYHGALGPVLGGVGGLQNMVGQHPHQMNPNPFSFMAGIG